MEDLVLSCLESRVEENRNLYARFLVGPFLKGDALTVATALRRVLLSSIESIGITALYIQGITHEFSTIVGVRESVLELSLNFQAIVLSYDKTFFQKKGFFDDLQIGYLQVQGPQVIYANHLKLPLGVKLVDPTQYIATVSKEGSIVLKFIIGKKKAFLHQNTGPESYFGNPARDLPITGKLSKKNIVRAKKPCYYKKGSTIDWLPMKFSSQNVLQRQVATFTSPLFTEQIRPFTRTNFSYKYPSCIQSKTNRKFDRLLTSFPFLPLSNKSKICFAKQSLATRGKKGIVARLCSAFGLQIEDLSAKQIEDLYDRSEVKRFVRSKGSFPFVDRIEEKTMFYRAKHSKVKITLAPSKVKKRIVAKANHGSKKLGFENQSFFKRKLMSSSPKIIPSVKNMLNTTLVLKNPVFLFSRQSYRQWKKKLFCSAKLEARLPTFFFRITSLRVPITFVETKGDRFASTSTNLRFVRRLICKVSHSKIKRFVQPQQKQMVYIKTQGLYDQKEKPKLCSHKTKSQFASQVFAKQRRPFLNARFSYKYPIWAYTSSLLKKYLALLIKKNENRKENDIKNKKTLFLKSNHTVFKSDICLRNVIPLDFTLTPVLKVNFVVEIDDEVLYLRQKVRERVILEVWTNGSIHPRQAVHDAALSLTDIFASFRSIYEAKS